MTKREAAIISAFTGILIGSIDNLKQYDEYIMKDYKDSIKWSADYCNELQKRAKEDFLNLKIED